MADQEEERDHHSEKLVGVAGALQTVIGSKPIAAMLTPAAEVYGEYFRKRALVKVAEWEEKKRKNIREHKFRVERVTSCSFLQDPTETQAQLAFEWAETAQNIDPDVDPELAALWESLLVEISEGSPHVRRLMSALRLLEPEDTVILLDRSQLTFTTENEKQSLQRLRSAGLIERRWRIRNYRIFSTYLLLMAALLYISTVFFKALPPYDDAGKLQQLLQRPVFAIQNFVSEISLFDISLVLIIILMTSFIAIDGRMGWFRFTELGKMLRQQGRDFRNLSRSRQTQRFAHS